MCNETKKNHAYNQFIIDEVVSHEGFIYEKECPKCKQIAVKRVFEACHTGSVNEHYTLNCKHCNYHECDQDACSICDSLFSDYNGEPGGYSEAQNIDSIVESLLYEMKNEGCINAIDWSFLKQYVHKNENLVAWYKDLFISEIDSKKIFSINSLLKYFQKQLLDVRFESWLDQQVEAAR